MVTADHETGGIGLSAGDYNINPALFNKQKISAKEIAKLTDKKSEVEIKEIFKP